MKRSLTDVYWMAIAAPQPREREKHTFVFPCDSMLRGENGSEAHCGKLIGEIHRSFCNAVQPQIQNSRYFGTNLALILFHGRAKKEVFEAKTEIITKQQFSFKTTIKQAQ